MQQTFKDYVDMKKTNKMGQCMVNSLSSDIEYYCLSFQLICLLVGFYMYVDFSVLIRITINKLSFKKSSLTCVQFIDTDFYFTILLLCNKISLLSFYIKLIWEKIKVLCTQNQPFSFYLCRHIP